MIEIEECKKAIRDKSVKKELFNLVSFSIKNKTLKLDTNYNGSIINLEKKGILLKTVQEIQLSENWFFTWAFYECFCEKKNFSIKRVFADNFDFLFEIKTEFNQDNYVYGSHILEQNLIAIVIYEAHRKFNLTFLSYLKSVNLEKDSEAIFLFNRGISTALPLLNLKSNNLYSILEILFELIKAEAGVLNGNDGNLQAGIIKKVSSVDSFGIDFFHYCLKYKKEHIKIESAIIHGVYTSLRNEFLVNELIFLIENSKRVISIICGLSGVNLESREEIDAYFFIYDKIKGLNEEVLLNQTKLLLTILGSDFVNDKPEIIDRCFNELNGLVQLKNENLSYIILNQIHTLRKFDDRRKALVLDLLRLGVSWVKNYFQTISLLFYDIKDFVFFQDLVSVIIEKSPFVRITKSFSNVIQASQVSDRGRLEEFVISLLIHDLPNYRFIGREIKDKYFNQFETDLSIQLPIDQYKLIVSVLYDHKEPDQVLPCLISILKSKSEFVREMFICKLEEYVENYGGLVLKVLESELDLEIVDNQEVYDRVKKHKNNFHERRMRKNGIKEINPFFSQSRIFHEYTKQYYNKFYSSIEKQADKGTLTSFLGGINTIHLAKGGGWKQENSDVVSSLHEHKLEFSLPRQYFVDPINFDLECQDNMRYDYGKWFNEIAIYLENEQ